MPSMKDASVVRDAFEKAGQGHVFKFYDSLDETAKKAFVEQLGTVDVERCNRIFKLATTPSETSGENVLEPLPTNCFDTTIGVKDPLKIKAWEKLGCELINKGEVAVLLLAGGQGTRLGSSAPKGCYDIGLPSHKSLFEMQAQRIIRLQKYARQIQGVQDPSHPHDVCIPWYVMTSGPTRPATEAFFKENKYFGMEEKNVIFFNQGTLPCFSMEGKIILADKGMLAEAPDGNGGVYAALEKEGILTDMEKRGVKFVHTYCVDNCLVRVADPVFMGYCVSKEAKCGAKVVPKASPEEPVGVVCLRNGKFQVVEYSEIDDETANKRGEDGSLSFRAANIANHFYTVDFLKTIASDIEPTLQYHVAKKKIPFIDDTGVVSKPTTPNGIKLELFIFDVFPFTETAMAVLEVPRQDEFSPLKNATGPDSAETSRADIMKQHVRFIEHVGGHVKPPKDGSDAIVCEISPLVSYGGENLIRLQGITMTSPVIIDTEEDIEKIINGSI